MVNHATWSNGHIATEKGTDDPMDRRPICLMPVLYRTRATRRARGLAQWWFCWEREGNSQGAHALSLEQRLPQKLPTHRG